MSISPVSPPSLAKPDAAMQRRVSTGKRARRGPGFLYAGRWFLMVCLVYYFGK
jgi:hypothetical protein